MKKPPFHLVLAALISLGVALCIISTRLQRRTGADRSSSFTPKCSGLFALRSSAVINGGVLPVEFTGDGASSTLPLEWSGAPPETKSYAVTMHHIDPQGLTKWYWTLYNIPANVHNLPKNVTGVGTLGNNSVNRRVGYAPPHSKGPGPKTYILTVYALSATVQISAPPSEVNRNVLLTAMKDIILDSAELRVVYDRTALIDRNGGNWRPGRPVVNGRDQPNP